MGDNFIKTGLCTLSHIRLIGSWTSLPCLQVPGGAAGYYLLGKLYTLTDNPSSAIAAFQAALMQDPLMWCAYEGLCRLGKATHTLPEG